MPVCLFTAPSILGHDAVKRRDGRLSSLLIAPRAHTLKYYSQLTKLCPRTESPVLGSGILIADCSFAILSEELWERPRNVSKFLIGPPPRLSLAHGARWIDQYEQVYA
ncbi:hypothetical protein E4U54_006708 [Claviceps lovelessii]|nr:hypothetical protein E4U54_006708 [Claviceps lovelessii]